jgi:hypothetical protein
MQDLNGDVIEMIDFFLRKTACCKNTTKWPDSVRISLDFLLVP